MSRHQQSFKELRDVLYRSLAERACIPISEVNKIVTTRDDQRFFPSGTSQRILTFNELERLFVSILATESNQTWASGASELAEHIERHKLHIFLAIMITSNCDSDAFLSFTRHLVAGGQLPELPVYDKDSLKIVFNNDVTVDAFFHRQHDFFAPVIRKNKEVKGQFRRVPYVKEKLIGQGSFGKIYEVVISPHHYDGGHSTTNNKEIRLARKDFELNAEDRAYEKERDVLRDIVRNATSHNGIMKSIGSLEIGLTYSLFMPLADCDLMQYMKLNPNPPTSAAKKAKLVDCAANLAGAISYLHEELVSPNYEKLSCFHMDLKPQNILVITDPDTHEQQWKLSDFNMSRVKMKRRHADDQPSLRRISTHGDNGTDINKLFKRRVPDPADGSLVDFTINRRGQGTYLAPEACIDGHPVHAESDTWSLGCVISVIFSYLHGGQLAVEEFQKRRSKNSLDCFFSFPSNNNTPRLNDAQVNEAVKRWHRSLRMETKQRNALEGAIFEAVINFLTRKVLVIDPNQRRQTSAKDVRQTLIDAFHGYQDMAKSSNIPSGPRNANLQGHLRGILDKAKGRFRHKSDLESQPSDWKFTLPATAKRCAFGPNAHPLVCVSDKSLTAYSFEHVLLSHDTDDFGEDLIMYGDVAPNNKGLSWNSSVGVSTQYVLAATNHHEFDCYFYQIPQPGNHNSNLELVAHWELKFPKIWKLALSPDAQHAAFVLGQNGPGQPNSSLYIIGLDWLRLASLESKQVSYISSSSASSSDPGSPLGRAIPLPCPAEDVCEISFSKVNGLYVVAKSRQGNDMTENVVHVYSWSVQGNRRTALPPTLIKHDGQDDLLRGLFTSFTPYNRDFAFAVISQERRIITRTSDFSRYTQSTAPGYRFFQTVLETNDEMFLAFGTQATRNDLQLFTFPAANLRHNLEIKSTRKLPRMTPQTKFIASIASFSLGALSQRHLLIVIMEDAAIRLLRLDLDR